MKKLSTLIVASSLVLSLAACGAKSNDNTSPAAPAPASPGAPASAANLQPESGASLLVWESKEERPFVEEMIKQFTAQYPGVKVKFEEVGAADQVKKLTTDGPAGIAADVTVFPHDQLGQAVTAGLVLPNDFYGDPATSENAAAAVKAVTYNNILYGYPRSFETYALFYNKKLVPTPPKTFEEIADMAKTMNDPKNNKYALMWDVGNFYFSYPFLATTGGYVFGKEGTDKTDIGLNNEGAVTGAKVFASLKQNVLPVNSGDISYDTKKGLFTGGTLGMDINGPWTIADYKKSGVDFGVVPLPTIAGKPTVSFAGVKGWYVNSFTKYPNASKLFARFASTKEAQLKEFQMAGSLPTNNDTAKDPSIAGDATNQAFIQQFHNAQPMPSIPEMGNVWTPIGAALSDIWNSGKDPKAALDNAVKQIKDANAAAGK